MGTRIQEALLNMSIENDNNGETNNCRSLL